MVSTAQSLLATRRHGVTLPLSLFPHQRVAPLRGDLKVIDGVEQRKTGTWPEIPFLLSFFLGPGTAKRKK